MTRRIDAHHHLWRYTAEEFGWLDKDLRDLRHDFSTGDLKSALAPTHVEGTIAVQARQTIKETAWLLEVARSEDLLCGVVGWLPLASPELPAYLEQFVAEPLLKGVRHVLQAEPDGFMHEPGFNEGIDRLRGTCLVYDLLILERQLPEAIRFVDRHPEQIFVLDHLGKPRIAAGDLDPWRTYLRTLAKRPNVACKLSGLVTEASPLRWTESQLKPYFDCAIEAFGPARCMVGSDWPVLTAQCDYTEWWNMVEGWVQSFSPEERAALLGGTAERIYHLDPSGKGNTSSRNEEDNP